MAALNKLKIIFTYLLRKTLIRSLIARKIKERATQDQNNGHSDTILKHF